MFDKIIDIISKLKIDYWFYIGIGIIALAFLIPLIASFVGGELNLFKKTATKVIKANDPKTVNGFMTTMPVKVKKLYKRAVLTKAKPSDIISVDSCVGAPYAVSLSRKIGLITLTATLLTMLFIGSVSAVMLTIADAKVFAILSVLALEGGLFTVISFCVSSSAYTGAVKTYNKLMDILDNFSKGGQMVNEEVSEDSPVEAVTIETSGMPEDEAPAHKAYDFDGPSRITVEIEDEEPKTHHQVTYEQPEYTASAESIVMAEPVEDEATIKARAREEALKQARAEAQARAAQAEARQRAEAQQAQQVKTAPPPVRPQPTPAAAPVTPPPVRPQPTPTATPVRPQPTAAAQGGASNADDVIARIEKINQAGAPLATMKEVALLLQQERAKPENKTPEQQRKLNEALSKLLKAMSGAGKK